jgi:hypothetical protein
MLGNPETGLPHPRVQADIADQLPRPPRFIGQSVVEKRAAVIYQPLKVLSDVRGHGFAAQFHDKIGSGCVSSS